MFNLENTKFSGEKKLKNQNTEETIHPSKRHLRTFPIPKSMGSFLSICDIYDQISVLRFLSITVHST